MKLLDWMDRNSPAAPLLLVVATFAMAALIAAAGRIPQNIATPTPALIYVLSTPVPTIQPTADTAMQETIARLEQRVAELETRNNLVDNVNYVEPVYQQMSAPQATPAGGYVAHTTEGDVVIPPDATPVPAGAAYDGPFLAPVATEQPAGPRLCEGFGDWRDYDPAYASSPACHK